MTEEIFILSAVLYWASFLSRFYLWTHGNRRLEVIASSVEKLAILTFTLALVLYIGKLQVVNGEVHSARYERPVSFLLFAWAIAAAQMVTEVAYGNTLTSVFANLWTALSLTISATAANLLRGVFTNDFQWLSFHRLCFLLGYAFCILAFPLVLSYLRINYRTKFANQAQLASMERDLWRIDRMGYRMVLWALPLLTAGIITELLLLMEMNRLPTPEQLLARQGESLLALTAWFLCGIYLHTRLFFGWKNLKSAALYLAGLLVLIGGHLTQGLLGTR